MPKHILAVSAAAALVAGGMAAIPLLAHSTGTASLSASGTTLKVAADGTGQYKTVQAAIDAVPANSTTAYTISVAKGTYHEVISVPAAKKNLTIKGATGNPEDVVITYGNGAATTKPSGGTYGTMGSATATFAANDFTLRGVTVTNSYGTGSQAVAVNAEGDRQVFENDRFLGHQDTLLAWAPKATGQYRQYFYSSFIQGDVDFIFGDSTAVFDHVNIKLLDRGAAAGGNNGFLTAANTDKSKTYGFLIANSNVTSPAKAGTFYLGRPWHPTADAVAQVVVRNTALPAAVKKKTPWTDMGGFSWKSARFDSYANTGDGAGVYSGSPQLTATQAATYTAKKYLAGTDSWNPVSSSTSTTSASASPTATATASTAAATTTVTGDARTVAEPSVPGTICKTVSAALAAPSGRTFSTAQETTPPDTSRIQAAIDACGSGAVKLVAAGSKTAFLTGPLTITKNVTLLLDSGVTLYGSRNPVNYQVSGKPTCGTLSSSSGGCKPLITVSGANAGIEAVRSSSGHQGTIDGRGDTAILGTSTTWWALATQAKTAGKNQQNPRLIQANKSDDFTLYDVNLVNAANFHVVYSGGTGFTAWGVRIKTPDTARNTDGIDPAGAKNVTIADSSIMTGDDGVAIKGGSAASNMTVKNNHFYGTHGISIGSETNGGVTNVLFSNNTLTGTDANGTASGSSTGIRIKSSATNGGKVTNVAYLNTCLSAVKAPIVFDTHYSSSSGSYVPSFTGILVNGVKATGSPKGATNTFAGFNASNPLGVTLENVSLDVTKNSSEYAAIKTYNSDITPSGTGVSVTKLSSGSGSVPACTFPSFPAL